MLTTQYLTYHLGDTKSSANYPRGMHNYGLTGIMQNAAYLLANSSVKYTELLDPDVSIDNLELYKTSYYSITTHAACYARMLAFNQVPSLQPHRM